MGENKLFCEKCRDYVAYSIKEESVCESLHGKICKYVRAKVTCNECGGELWCPEHEDNNLERLYNAYQINEA